ncbi:alpha-ketoglutarate-dependent dioxygenase AlkB [Endozoicomonas atrinae]|uniref:alpha-ketoglutarate-dependent dioxygenase AlkB n=1 Tax=Endozoicomonas atrinae TaxID=1333660 RepID=UPI003B007B6C
MKEDNKTEITIHPQSEQQLLQDNVFYCKNCLDEEGQIAFVKECTSLMKEDCNAKLLSNLTGDTYDFAQSVLFYNWPSQPESLKLIESAKPDGILNLGDQLHQKAYREFSSTGQSTDNEEQSVVNIPESFSPRALYGILYQPGSSFGAHQDGANGWTIALSLGSDADFFYLSLEASQRIAQRIKKHEKSEGRRATNEIITQSVRQEPDSERNYIRVKSGDALLFNGGQLFHGVSKVYSDTPEFWKNSIFAKNGMTRFNLQFRDPFRDTLTYNPYFEHKD